MDGRRTNEVQWGATVEGLASASLWKNWKIIEVASVGDLDVIPVLGSVTKVNERWGVPSLNICL
jgi:hypothetical protein